MRLRLKFLIAVPAMGFADIPGRSITDLLRIRLRFAWKQLKLGRKGRQHLRDHLHKWS